MKNLPLVLIVAGIVLLGYWGYDYSQNSHSASVGDLEISMRESTSLLPAILGGISLLAGAALALKGKK